MQRHPRHGDARREVLLGNDLKTDHAFEYVQDCLFRNTARRDVGIAVFAARNVETSCQNSS